MPSRYETAGEPSIRHSQPILTILQNILIASTSPIRVKITDFGVSKRAVGTSLRTGCGTDLYRAPEQLGLLPKKMARNPRNSYTNAVDLWALGVIVHQILTSEIPFLDIDQDEGMEKVSNISTTSDPTPEMDMDLVYKYCRGLDSFPSQSLHINGVSDEGKNFVTNLMTADPSNRVSATDALKSIWLIEINISAMKRNRLRSQLEGISVNLSSDTVNMLCTVTDRVGAIDVFHSLADDTVNNMQGEAVSGGYHEVVKLVLLATDPSNLMRQDPELAWLPLAAANCQIDVMQLLLDRGINVNETPATGTRRTALQEAAMGGHLDAITLLIRHGADINLAFGGRTALQAAAGGGHFDAMKLLLRHGADINQAPAEGYGRTALQAAAQHGNLEAMNLLLRYGADINQAPAARGGMTALQAATQRGHLEAMKLLILHNADINAAPAEGYGLTALQAAAQCGNLNAMNLLLRHEADINAMPAEVYGVTALQAAAQRGHLEAINLLLRHGADINAMPAERGGLTALQAAAQGGHIDAMKLLIFHKADMDAAPAKMYGVTALQATLRGGGNAAAVKLLVDNGVFVDDSSRTRMQINGW